MDVIMNNEYMLNTFNNTNNPKNLITNLSQAEINKEYKIKDIQTDDEELKDFLFTLGCYKGEAITIISVLVDNYVITVKDARYSIDNDLAEAIIIN